ncbi:MAG: hypothetical protein U5K37_11625 [Natrialbaceae archaeon]|nr:hypothetical protein [Natrialbaceae archaeon]
MPITIETFESGALGDEEHLPLTVASFLAQNRAYAFTQKEIAAAIDENLTNVTWALGHLEETALVRHRGRYWAITDDYERLRAASDHHRVTESLNERE